jgi:hypothetical protein
MVLVKTNVSEELSASIIRVTRIGELGTTSAVTSNRSSPTLVLQEPHGVTSQKTSFFIATAVKTSNLTWVGLGQDKDMRKVLVNAVMTL